jgi:TP901 family phage tail tape measure protein
MPDFAVSTQFRAQDQVTRAFGRMDRGADRFGRNASRAFRRASRSGSRFGDIVKGILTAGAIRKGVGLLSRGLREATTEFISFDDAIKSSTARFGDLDVKTKAGQKSIAELGNIARKVGAETEFTATEAAKGLELFALAGLSVSQSVGLLPGTVNLATAANTDLARAVEVGTKSLGAFGLMTKDTVQLQKNFTRVSDLLAATATSSQTDIDSMFESIAAGGITFTESGQTMETFAALVGKMANKTIIGEKAGTALRNVMLRLANPSKEAASALGFLGVQVADKKGDFRDIIDIIGDFEKSTKGLGTQERAAALDIIFGKKAINSFNVILGEGSKSLRNYRDELIASGGASNRMAEIMRGSLGKRLAALKSAAIEVGFKFLEAFQKNGQGAISALTNALRNFDVSPIVNAVKKIASVFQNLFNDVAPFLPAIGSAIMSIGRALDAITPSLETMIKGFVIYKGLLIATMAIDAARSFLGVASAIRATSGAFGLVKAAFALSPFGAVITGIGLLVGALAFLQDKFQIFDKLFDRFKFIRDAVGLAKRAGQGIVNFFGFGDEEKAAPTRKAPNRFQAVTPPNFQDELARRQQFALNGEIKLSGAPDNTVFNIEAPGVKASVLGANP